MEYDNLLVEKARKENKALIQMVDSGQFDGIVATKLFETTIMSIEKMTKNRFRGKNPIDKHLKFWFSVPFNREMEEIKPFGRKYYVSDGLGCHYIELENNMVGTLKERYPFFQKAELCGDRFYDFKYVRGMWGIENHRVIDNSLEFGLQISQDTFASSKQEVFEWLSSSYGMIDISTFLKQIKFNEKEVSRKIKNYRNAHSKGG